MALLPLVPAVIDTA